MNELSQQKMKVKRDQKQKRYKKEEKEKLITEQCGN